MVGGMWGDGGYVGGGRWIRWGESKMGVKNAVFGHFLEN